MREQKRRWYAHEAYGHLVTGSLAGRSGTPASSWRLKTTWIRWRSHSEVLPIPHSPLLPGSLSRLNPEPERSFPQLGSWTWAGLLLRPRNLWLWQMPQAGSGAPGRSWICSKSASERRASPSPELQEWRRSRGAGRLGCLPHSPPRGSTCHHPDWRWRRTVEKG